MRHGCLFVYSPNTPFEVTETECPHGVTRFRALAILDHDGDLSANLLDPQWCVVTPHDVRALASVEDGESDVDPEVGRRYMELHGAMVDATRLDQLPKSTPLIDDVLMRDSLAWLHGKPGHAKSFIALDWACCVATGRQWRGHTVEQSPVLFVVAEGAHGIHERRQAWEITNSTTIEPGRLLFLPVAVQMLNKLDVPAVAMIAAEIKPVLIVLDTQARVTVGADENSSKDMGLYVAAVDQLRLASAACLLTVHHEARAGDSLRGSTALEGAATTVIRATKDGTIVRLDCTKQKDGPEFDPIVAQLVTVKLPSGSLRCLVPRPRGTLNHYSRV